MEELVHLSRTVAAELAAEFRGNPRGELAAWLHIALEREGLVASLYERQTIDSRLQSLPKHFARSVAAKVNGICANEETHLTIIRRLLAADCAWPQMTFEESWGRLQGFVLGQLAGTNVVARAIALLLLEIGARSTRERSAGRAVAGLDVGGFLRFSRTLEVTAVESYQRVAALLAALRRRARGSSYSLAFHLKILRILRDERVHRDVLHVLYGTFGGDAAPHTSEEGATELPDRITAQPVSSRADLNAVCRAILVFHYGAALPTGASPEKAQRTAVDYWRWQMENPLHGSYLVERQHQDVFRPDGEVLLLGSAGLQQVTRGMSSLCTHRFDPRLIPQFMAAAGRRDRRVRAAASQRRRNAKRDRPPAPVTSGRAQSAAPNTLRLSNTRKRVQG